MVQRTLSEGISSAVARPGRLVPAGDSAMMLGTQVMTGAHHAHMFRIPNLTLTLTPTLTLRRAMFDGEEGSHVLWDYD